MSSAREKDKICTCENKIFLNDINEIVNIINGEDFSKEKRYEIWLKEELYCFLEYVDSEDRWYLFIESIDIQRDENNNWSSHILEISNKKESS